MTQLYTNVQKNKKNTFSGIHVKDLAGSIEKYQVESTSVSISKYLKQYAIIFNSF